ncbi:torsin family 1 isoform X2 [Denticeps clupeoides]|uniref:torsin family 1 isoform X2 n=1 Tax=Denticeps clupeoides TaxID=299321 RepID=UPI0010A2B1E7|nr:torsin-1A-like isoform X2 [Denticeps clupeoides]
MRRALIVLLLVASVKALEPISTTIFVGTGAAVLGKKLYNYIYESCDANWIAFNATGLEQALQKKLFGQHVASRVILKAVTGYMNNPNPKKPLVLSLHGWTGTGKNFVSHLIAENLYTEGMHSRFVHLFTATAHFPHEKDLEMYKAQLQQWVKGNVSNCGRSMFIFDEMDKMQTGLIDSIKPYLDYYEQLDGVSYRKAIFILLSNTGGESIGKVALDFWNAGREREEIELHDLEKALSLSVFNNKKSGLWHTSLIDKNLVDYFVPFLPLEYKHVVQCGLNEMVTRGLKPDTNVVEQMAKDFIYYPKEERLFSVPGCKLIPNKLNFYLLDP